MKKWSAKDWVAFILAMTIPFFLLMWMIETFALKGTSALGVERTKLWIAFMTTLGTGLLVWISNHNKHD